MAIPALQRTFGVEIETCLPLAVRDLFPYDFGGIHGLDGWTSHGDGSIRAYSGYFGTEVVSPVLTGSDGLQNVVRVVNWLKVLGARPNDSTGLHVHVGASDLAEQDVLAVSRAFVRYEMAFLALNGPDTHGRRSNDYCRLSDSWRGTNRRGIPSSGRYQSLNFTNWQSNHGIPNGKDTLECRIWQSTLSDTRVVAAINMFVALVTRAAELGASTHERISDPKEAMRTFIHNHFGKGMRSLDLRIEPEITIGDVCLAAWHEAKHAT